jgi:hypothetical protein
MAAQANPLPRSDGLNWSNTMPTTAPSSAPAKLRFGAFYRDHFLLEHRHPINRALHVAGTFAGLAWLPLTLWSSMPWLVLLFPAVHAAPGLVGHRLYERNPQVGDVRVLRKDFPPWWFIAANHRLTFELMSQRASRLLGRR